MALAAASHALHLCWYEKLRDATEIDYELEVGGAVYLARSQSEIASLVGLRQTWIDERIDHQVLGERELRQLLSCLAAAELEPPERPGAARVGLARKARVGASMVSTVSASEVDPPERRTNTFSEGVHALFSLHDAQLRPPRFLQALRRAVEFSGARIVENAGEVSLLPDGDSITGVVLNSGERVRADEVCVAAGAWSTRILEAVDVSAPVVPMRGQVIAYQLAQRPFVPCIYEGSKYIVPRRDGLLLVGSTVEQAGFEKTVTESAMRSLSQFAASIMPELAARTPTFAWSGLRPASFDGFPFIGRVPNWRNLIVATGHFRAGIHLAPITAVLVSQLIRGETVDFDMRPFRIGRGIMTM